MTWISLVCLLALSSSAFARSSYGSFSGASLFKPPTALPQAPLPTINADQIIRPSLPTNSYGSSYGAPLPRNNLILDLPKPATLPLTEADLLCKGKPADFVIVLAGGEKFVVCTSDSKGDEVFCPRGLLYNEETRRCERKYNPNQNPCASQPCLNGGRCVPTQYSYQCECAQGYAGRTCELDASVCQQQQPCGSSFDHFCQSFHVGAALKHVCIVDEGRAYGLTSQQTFSNPCLSGEGMFPLGFGNKGFIMCDGEKMFIESCPGGTIWDSLTKVCVWPEMEGTITIRPIPVKDLTPEYGSSYSEVTPAPLPPSPPRVLDQVPLPSLPSNGYSMNIPRKLDLPTPPPTDSYGGSMNFPRSFGAMRRV